MLKSSFPKVPNQLDVYSVWGGIVGNYLIGPYFFNGTVNGERYLDFLQNQLQNFLDDVPLEIIRRLCFQQDGAPPHYAAIVRDFLDQEYVNRWIGGGGPITWPPRSPNLTKLDFFLWGYVKELVYHEPPTTMENMQDRIRVAFQLVNNQMLTKVEDSFVKRLRSCIHQNGQHIEHVL